MKILFIVPSIKNSGGVARVTSLKANYFIDKWNYNVDIICQDQESENSFFKLNSKINIICLPKNSGNISYLWKFYNQVNTITESLEPQVVIVVDNGFKGFMFSLFTEFKGKLIFEVHGSRFENVTKKETLQTKFKNVLRVYGLRKYKKVAFLTYESAKEWNFKNPIIIPNCNPIQTDKKAKLESKTIVSVARHSYEKGIDRLLSIWKRVSQKNPSWKLEIYGEETEYSSKLYNQLNLLGLNDSVQFNKPDKDIESVILNASVLVMTSRFEGFGLVLVEAMSCGVPVIAYDCPIGPKSIIEHNANGFLIEDGNEEEFVNQLNLILNNQLDLSELIQKGIETAQKYNIDDVMQSWKLLLKE